MTSPTTTTDTREAIIESAMTCFGRHGLDKTTVVDIARAADVSRSMDEEKFQVQCSGYAVALSDPWVIEAIRAGPSRRVAVAFVEWSGPLSQKIVIDWTDDGWYSQDAFAHGGERGVSVSSSPRTCSGTAHPKGCIRLSLSSIRPSISTENPIPEEMDHREIAVRVPVMNEMQFLFPSEPCKSLKPRSLYVVFLVEKDVRVERRRTRD